MTATPYRLCWSLLVFALLLVPPFARARDIADPAKYVREHYVKHEHQIPMRDGVKLFTVVYTPKGATKKYPILMTRTPYGVGPYGKERYRRSLGPSRHFLAAGYSFAYQDVRGCYMSEGKFVNMTPHVRDKKSKKDIDESTDTYDTVDWLVKNVPNNNGRVGVWGISYPGFYAAAGMIDAHPALAAVSPQAPIADWWFDDFHHHGAFFLPHAFHFLSGFGQERPEPTSRRSRRLVDYGTPDGYQFYLNMGPLKNADAKYFKGRIAFWNEMCEHPNYDDFWKARNILPHLKKVSPAVMTVGGWFDAEDLYGPLKIYRAIEKQDPDAFNVLVMGPWRHGGWARTGGDRLGNIHFGAKTSDFYQKEIELPFFNHYLKGEDRGGEGRGGEEHRGGVTLPLPEAYVFETGANRWRKFGHWPPRNVQTKHLYFHDGGRLSFDAPDSKGGADAFVSDPNKPVPFTEKITVRMDAEYMTDDQRFAARRPDVLVYQTDVLKEDVTLAGPLVADLWVSTTGTDADWVVKVIDVFPDSARPPKDFEPTRPWGGYQMMVRSEVIRGRFRNGHDKPVPFVPNEPAKVSLELQDVLHTFKKGHRVMVQVQSSWFPLVDRNPQKFVPNIYKADAKDFIKATHRVHRAADKASSVRVGILPPG